jgi:hypothetical protein
MQRHEVIAGCSFLRLAFMDAFPKMTLRESLSRQYRAWGSVPQNRGTPNRDARIQSVFQSAFGSIDFVLSRQRGERSADHRGATIHGLLLLV